MSIGYRPKGESGPIYHPDRDYAYITPTLMRAAIERLDKPSDEGSAWKQEHSITDDELASVATALARAQRDFINAADPVTSLEHALNRRDFLEIRYPVRQFLFATIGEVFCAAWFQAVREVTKVNEESAASPGMGEFIASVRSLVGAAGDSCANNLTVAQLQLRNDVLQSRIKTLYQRVQTLELQAAEASAKAAASQPAIEDSWFRRLFSRK
jgi:hypothetical protein